MAKVIHEKYDELDYLMLKSSGVANAVAGTVAEERCRFDSADDAAVFFARELDYVKAKTYEKVYPQLTALSLFPRTSEVDPGAETLTYYTYEKTGVAKIISNYATDLPRVDIKGNPSTVHIKGLGDSYGYSVQEMRASRYQGKNLDARKADTAHYAIDNLDNLIAWVGDESTGLVGVLSDSNDIPVFTPTGKFDELDPDEIIAEITSWYKYIAELTAGIEVPDTLCLPTSLYLTLQNKRLPNTSSSVLTYITDNIKQLKSIVQAPELAANSTATNPYAAEGLNVAFLFTNDAEKLAIEEPLPFTQHPVQVKGLESIVNCEARTAGVVIYYPYSALIIPGV